MVSKKNTACTLKVGQIEKDPILALGTSEKDVENYGRVARAYGNVVPAIVGQRGGAYRILAGQARLEACAHQGIREMPAIVTEISTEAEQMKLALLLSTVRDGGGALSEGAFIDALITRHGISRRELIALLKKSKSWITKRQSLALRLSENVKVMVKDGIICARSAEEIAKMPSDVQVAFASAVARDYINKTHVGQLVSLYIRSEADSALRTTIMDSPLAVLDACPSVSVSRRKEKRSEAERIADKARFLIRLASELKGLLACADSVSISMVSSHLSGLHTTIIDLLAALSTATVGVLPGKLKGGDGT